MAPGANLNPETDYATARKRVVHKNKSAEPVEPPKSLKEKRKTFKPAPPELLKKVRDAIPKHCFERNLLKSMSYVIHDLILISLLGYAASHIDSTIAQIHPLLPYLAWPVYWYCQGAVMVGIWILAHECGHRAFSNYRWVDNTVGFILHSSVLVPFFSWKITHSNHHKMTCHMERDSVFIPFLRSEYNLPPATTAEDLDNHGDDHEILDSIPILHLRSIFYMLFFGWPAYLIANTSGQKFGNKWISHFFPNAPIFEPSQFYQVVLSNIGLLTNISILTYFSYSVSFLSVLKFYLIPYIIVNFWLTLITYLQHTDEKVPHYRESEFTFVRGALSTVDRDFGILNHFFHRITDTHVVHHMFSQMPHYHAEEATAIAKEILGEYYLRDDSNMFVALWNSIVRCRFVEDEGDVVWYKH